MATKETDSTGVKTTRTVFSVIETLQEWGDSGVTELADHLDLAPSTVHNHLTTLEREGYVVRHDGRYRLGLRFLRLGVNSKHINTIARLVSPVLDRVTRETEEIAWFVVEESGEAVCIDRTTETDIGVSRQPGDRYQLHTTAGGKAILAQMDRDRIHEIMDDQPRSTETDAAVPDRTELMTELETIREEGIATSRAEESDGLATISVPIVYDERVYGAISVSGPSYPLTESSERNEIAGKLKHAANEIEVRIIRSENRAENYPLI